MYQKEALVSLQPAVESVSEVVFAFDCRLASHPGSHGLTPAMVEVADMAAADMIALVELADAELCVFGLPLDLLDCCFGLVPSLYVG